MEGQPRRRAREAAMRTGPVEPEPGDDPSEPVNRFRPRPMKFLPASVTVTKGTFGVSRTPLRRYLAPGKAAPLNGGPQ